MNSTLYYPTIEFNNPEWVWSAALLWDKVYRIVPQDYIPKDSYNIKYLTENSDFISNISPGIYVKESTDEFMDYLNAHEKSWAAALDNSSYQNKEYIKLHKDKADVKIRDMILAKENINSNWLSVPHDMASIYMLYLSTYIAKKCNISLSTDYAEAWCGSNYFQYEGNINDDTEEEPLSELSAITINKLIPNNIMSLSPEQLIKFRDNSREERVSYFESIRTLSTEIGKCKDKKIISDIISIYCKDIDYKMKNYMKRFRDLKTTYFWGLETIMVPVLTEVLKEVSNISSTKALILNTLGIGIGTIGGFWEAKKAISLGRENYECNYLYHLNQEVPCGRSGLYTDTSMHWRYQQYLSDNLNHFLRD